MTPTGIKILTAFLQNITSGLFGLIRDSIKQRRIRRAVKKNRRRKSNLGTAYGRKSD